MNRRVIRWNPVREVAAMQGALDRLFDDFRPLNGQSETGYALPVDLVEEDAQYVLTTELPGADLENINIRIHNEYLTIEAEVPETVVENKDARTLVRERRTGHFSRRIHLAQTVDADSVEATFDNGVLTLTLPKVPEAQPRNIAIKSRN
jgi:HSP20 family protein